MPCEMLHAAITAGVTQRVSLERISRFIANYAFMHHCHEHLQGHVYDQRQELESKVKNMTPDVNILVAWFKEQIGPDWATASRARQNSILGMSQRGRTRRPWAEVRAAMTAQGADSPAQHINTQLQTLTASFYAFYSPIQSMSYNPISSPTFPNINRPSFGRVPDIGLWGARPV